MKHWKRGLRGLPTPEEIVIKSLAEFVNLFSCKKLDCYIFRGEPTNYHNIVSSALREGEYPFIKIKNEFYRAIFHRITSEERNNFLAFSQHYGIPTNLIDFTENPLIALYFACQTFVGIEEQNDLDKKRGFVYLLRDEVIDITDILSRNEDENLLNLFIKDDTNLILDLYKKFFDFEKKFPERFYYYFRKLNEDWKYYIIDGQPLIAKKYRFCAYNNGEYKYKLKYENIGDGEWIQILEKKYGEVELVVLEYTLKLQRFLKYIIDTGETVWWLNCIPNFLYTPILSFERGRNQKGLFIYQSYLSFDEDTYGSHIVSRQRVWPDKIIVVENKEKILQELDFIGINEKFIYGDYDSIAKYIKNKYGAVKEGFGGLK